eukprot:CAMPEP_0198334486 /NCGR_PEP_ID=MMETSP1450-20131203/19644_1 /TAXON_ID=753684 ORGANISM="Madagascaria erythrocladiodes, Strain CCMP3234" /NCGR_SAMPLE_ID=MMETSP1450 /ASSEMBLY_ACC=CAM_ASM_001115 /LENGTH=159 /DNA_ID=CAMNT_0044039079 /DNA_START=63 /DNA_END=540 /DNA_ORIENTATION=+
MTEATKRSVQCFGRKRNATAVAHVKAGKGLIKVNGTPIDLVEPQILRYKVYEPLLLLGAQRFAQVDVRVRVSGGGHVSQIYAIRQAIAKGIVAYYQKYVDEQSKTEVRDLLLQYDRTLLVADPAAASRRSSAARARVHATRSRTANADVVDDENVTCYY